MNYRSWLAPIRDLWLVQFGSALANIDILARWRGSFEVSFHAMRACRRARRCAGRPRCDRTCLRATVRAAAGRDAKAVKTVSRDEGPAPFGAGSGDAGKPACFCKAWDFPGVPRLPLAPLGSGGQAASARGTSLTRPARRANGAIPTGR